MKKMFIIVLFGAISLTGCADISGAAKDPEIIGEVTFWKNSRSSDIFLDTDWYTGCGCGFVATLEYPTGCLRQEFTQAELYRLMKRRGAAT